ncbi:putative quinol monooxygenase [Sinorhizobium meliloti]|uniref:putative quinol monooxygenase n=1 Tax=Rhizobium meliloti TaxID=382 RepID=UPI000B4A1DD1|nr:putative quinol monooxygenase [Sinorhizobium meliloti]ASP93483.1 antibiotic biosynthesis monooxygenase [Sinorhizobium meliloti]MQX55321.1 antibiotic biosynthesis monooxygenase [Sinorhizobium meliloti]RVJ68639.1 antibiotic biosynthesis monooxygenase [Sinorhizobium meliloti]RVJ85824.1 antibiotic biosynthesis monooxygenase [Sinorhizobium meliloti]
MTSSIKVVARVTITPGKEDAFEPYAAELSVAARAEEGCLSYHLHRNLNQKGVYVFVEEWASRQIWEQHMSGEAIRVFNRQLPPGTIANIEIHPLEQIA